MISRLQTWCVASQQGRPGTAHQCQRFFPAPSFEGPRGLDGALV